MVNGQTTTKTAALEQLNPRFCKYAHTLGNDLKDQRLPASVGSTANASFRITHPTQIVLHQERLARIRYHRPPFSLFEVSSSQKNRFLGLLGNIPEFLLDHYHSERSGTKFEHQSETEFKICTHGSEVRNCRDQRWPEGFFSRSSRSRLRRSIFAANDRKKASGPRVVLQMKFSEFYLCFHNSCEIWHFFARSLVLLQVISPWKM